MFYEEKVGSFSGLAKRLRSIDQDAAVRLLGRSGKRKVLVFVTRFETGYTVMTYSVNGEGAPGKRLQMVELDGVEKVIGMLRELVKGKLQAWIY